MTTGRGGTCCLSPFAEDLAEIVGGNVAVGNVGTLSGGMCDEEVGNWVDGCIRPVCSLDDLVPVGSNTTMAQVSAQGGIVKGVD